MNRILCRVFLGLALMTAMPAVAGGLAYAVSLERAKELAKADGSKHIMIFYTEEW